MNALSGSFKFIIVSLLSVFLFSCGGENDNSSLNTGTVALLVTDGPSNDFTAINLHITRAELLSDSGRVTLFEGEKVFDLLQLANVTEIFSVTNVPVGSYDKIRLTLTQIELVLMDGTAVYPKLPGNGKLDLNPRGSFFVGADTTLMIQLDIDAEKSIHIVKTGNSMKYQFRPVVFIKIITDALDTKLVRLTGTVNNLDTTGGTFDLCEISAQQVTLTEDNLPLCIKINTLDAKSSFFDPKGDPADINDLSDGDIVTVVGHFSFSGPIVTPLSMDENGNMILIAEVIWSGDYAQVLGVARSIVFPDPLTGDHQFEYDVIPGKGYVVDGPVSTILATGTKIFSRLGHPLSEKDIQPGVPAKVDGVFQFSSANIAQSLKAALVILDTQVALTKISGIIGDISSDYTSMMLKTDAGDRCVTIDSNATNVFEVIVDADKQISFKQVTAFALQTGQQASVFGTENSGCLIADTVIFEQGDVVSQPL